jgi:hypothetical protein
MKVGTWDAMSLSESGFITAAAKELTRYKLDLVGIQEVKWDQRGTATVEIIIFVMEKKRVINSNRIFCTTQKNISSYESRVC